MLSAIQGAKMDITESDLYAGKVVHLVTVTMVLSVQSQDPMEEVSVASVPNPDGKDGASYTIQNAEQVSTTLVAASAPLIVN